MSTTTNPELCSLETNNVDFADKLKSPLGLFGLKSFYGFVILDGRTESIACLAFYLFIKMWENLYKKLYQK